MTDDASGGLGKLRSGDGYNVYLANLEGAISAK